MVIHSLAEPATTQQFREMLQEYGDMIKVVVDIQRDLLAGGGEMHADCEQVLLDEGSLQDDLWGANWFPADQRVEFESLINIRPRASNRTTFIEAKAIQKEVERVIRKILGDVS